MNSEDIHKFLPKSRHDSNDIIVATKVAIKLDVVETKARKSRGVNSADRPAFSATLQIR
jgi:hypothetical protein